MKIIYFKLVLLLFYSNLYFAQNGNANIVNGNVSSETLRMRSGYLSPISTEGSPFIYPQYKKASIANNKTLVDMRYNAYKDEVEIVNNGQNMTIFKRPEYSPIHIIDSDEYIYLLDYTYNGKKMTGYLFQVKKCQGFDILMRISKSFDKGRYAQDSFDLDKTNSYEDVPDVFFIKKDNGEVLQLPDTKKKLIELFPDKKVKIEQSIKVNKIDTRKLESVTQLINALS